MKTGFFSQKVREGLVYCVNLPIKMKNKSKKMNCPKCGAWLDVVLKGLHCEKCGYASFREGEPEVRK